MGSPLTNDIGMKALKKLKAIDVTPKGAAHPKYEIVFRGQVVAVTGLRRSSKPDIPVPHIKNDLRVSQQFILDLARCPKSREDWLRAQHLLQEGEDEDTPRDSDSN